ncbi:MAG: bifunctional folylpolyglutamate synthase/dihydrofolate synthase [Anaerolineae bacterium]
MTSAYQSALAYIYRYTNYERLGMPKYTMTHYDLERMRTLLARLADPHRKFRSLLIAGTKGKGSTAAFAESMIRAAGYRTGLYTSPHLHSFRERIKIDGQLIAEEEVVRLTEVLRPHAESIAGLTAFELITAMAFYAFAEAGVEVAVLEVGLGGRLDATNAVHPVVAVITSISYDHMQLLGDTLWLIAREKAGIIRPGALVVSAPQMPEAMTLIEEVCAGRRAELVVVGEGDYRWLRGHATMHGQWFELQGERYWIPLLGRHQIANAVTAWAAVDGMEQRAGLVVPPVARRQGLCTAEWPGRLEILHSRPYLVVDSAHNGDSASKLRQALCEFFPGRRVTLVFGASGDHPFKDALSELLPIATHTLVTQSRHPRAAAPEALLETVVQLGYHASIVTPVGEAIVAALQNSDTDDLICVTGSVFTVADTREFWFRYNGLPLPPIDPPV